MRLAARITTVFLLGVLLLIAVAHYAILQRENAEMTRTQLGEASQLGLTVSRLLEEIGESRDPARAAEILRELDAVGQRGSMRIVYFDVDPQHIDAPTSPEIDYAALQSVHTLRYRDPLGHEYLRTYARVTFTPRPAAIELSEPMEHTDRNYRYFLLHTVILATATLLLGAVLMVTVGGAWIAKPLQQLIEKTRRIGAGDLSGPLQLDRRDEFGELARALNSLCDQLRDAQHKIDAEARARIAAMDQLRHADRLRTVGRLAAGLAHELGTPLNVVSGRAALISSGRLPDDEVQRSAVIIKSEADRIATIIRQLLDFARRNTPQRKPTDLIQLTRQTIQLLTPIAEKRQSRIDLQAPAHPLSLDLDSAQIQQVLTNLMVNAVESMPRGGPVQVTIDELAAAPPEQTAPRPTPCVRLAVCDKGQGIAPEIQEQIFEPFFTTKDVGEGTGLGLSITYGIVQEHGGWIEVESQPGQGSCFSVYLPREPVACQTVS